MFLAHLKLRNFRNYAHAELAFSPKVNVFWGRNGQGKTNLLEAIHVLSTGRSFRTQRLQDLIKEGETHFYIEAQFVKEEITQSLKIYYDGASKKILYNETSYPYFSALLGILPSTLLSPDDITLITGSPAERRRFLDLHIAQIDPLYLFYLSRYYKAMKQRNELLRAKNEETLSQWEQVMVPAAAYLIAKRKGAAQQLQEASVPWMELFSREEKLGVSYETFLQRASEEDLSSHWQAARNKEMHYGTTLAGPHRDDLSIHLSGREAKHFSSEGQKRSCIAALRFAQWQHMEKRMETAPLLAIDDFGIQLDGERYAQLKEHLAHFGQVFVTSPYPIASDFREFSIENGQIHV
jgi:DNA replication and repair protein RecF